MSKITSLFFTLTLATIVVLSVCIDSSLAYTCPDNLSTCPEGSTCCILSDGNYGCCPLPNATCCSDFIHCCPQGFTCDATAGKCSKGSLVLAVSKKFPSMGLNSTTPNMNNQVNNNKVNNNNGNNGFNKNNNNGNSSLGLVFCPDSSCCYDGQTCCIASNGYYACCPLPSATCCPDKLYCCPNGYKCATGACTLQGELPTPLYSKFPTMPPPSKPNSDDATSNGNDSNDTNDKSNNNNNNNNGVDKNDHKNNFEDDDVNSPQIVACPDGSYCSDGYTCCVLASGYYACCPFPSADCCADKLHCCPNGYTCNTTTSTCTLGLFSIPAGKKQPSLRKAGGNN